MDESKELELIKFDHTEAKLREIVALTKDIVEVNITDKDELKKVKEGRLALGKVRIDIKKFGKDKRDWFNKMSSAIIGREKELLAIVEPEESRLKEFEEEAKALQLRGERLALLPYRRTELEKIGDKVEVSDDELCEMDAETFKGYCNQRLADQNEADRIAIAKKEDELNAKEIEAKKQEEIKEAIEKTKDEEKEKAEKRESERIEAEKREAEEKEAEKLAEAKREKEEKEAEEKKLEADERFKKWLNDNGCTSENKSDFIIERLDNGKVRLSKIVAIYNPGE